MLNYVGPLHFNYISTENMRVFELSQYLQSAIITWKIESESQSLNCIRLFVTPWTIQPTSYLYPWNSPGKNTGEDSHSLLQRIFPTQGLNPGLLHCRQILYHQSLQESLITCKVMSKMQFCSMQKHCLFRELVQSFLLYLNLINYIE